MQANKFTITPPHRNVDIRQKRRLFKTQKRLKRYPRTRKISRICGDKEEQDIVSLLFQKGEPSDDHNVEIFHKQMIVPVKELWNSIFWNLNKTAQIFSFFLQIFWRDQWHFATLQSYILIYLFPKKKQTPGLDQKQQLNRKLLIGPFVCDDSVFHYDNNKETNDQLILQSNVMQPKTASVRFCYVEKITFWDKKQQATS